MTKKNVLLVGIITLLIPVLLWVLNEKFGLSCRYVNEDGHTTKYCGIITLIVLPLISPIPFSLLTYRMRDEAFRAWWNPARWWIPIIMLATLITSIIDSQSGSSIGDFPISPFVLGVLYFLFVSSSLWRIVRTNRKQ